jgi:GAF domain-containing protein
LNVLAADVVSLDEFRDSGFDPRPQMAGRLRDRQPGASREDDIRWAVLKAKNPIFAADVRRDWPAQQESDGPTFVAREKIQSAIGVPLRNGKACVGVLFIYFRVRRDFSDWERRLIDYVQRQCGAVLGAARNATLKGPTSLSTPMRLPSLVSLPLHGIPSRQADDRPEA